MIKRDAFSLTEGLFVVVIISILAALGVPVLHNLRESSKSSVCASNLRQIGIGLQTYAADYKGYMPPTSTNYLAANGSTIYVSWHRLAWSYFTPSTYSSPQNYERYDSRKLNIFVCPKTRNSQIYVPTKVNNPDLLPYYTYSYAMLEGPSIKAYGTTNAFDYPMNRNWIQNPQETALVIEATRFGVTTYHYYHYSGLIPHKQGMNVCFYDGHVQKINYDDIPTSQAAMFWRGR
jgi:prepilin-type processing-associated H-X9-DG protein